MTFVEEDLRDKNGKPYTYYQLESKFDAVIVVPVLPDGRMVFERIYRHPYRHWFLEFPAGGINPGEDPKHAAIRELQEETGYHAGRAHLLGSFEAMPGLLRMRLSVVLADKLAFTGKISLDAMEMLEVVTLTEAEAWREAEKQPASCFLTMGLAYLRRAKKL